MDDVNSSSNPDYQNAFMQKCTQNASPAWRTINRELSQFSKNLGDADRFWWSTTGVTFAILLEKAGYSFEQQCDNLRFYVLVIVKELGEGPQNDGSPKLWRSFMSDHFNPTEFSWEWNTRDNQPTVRFSFEPIGPFAGTSEDPLNRFATLQFIETHVDRFPNCDISLFKHFWDKLVCFTSNTNSKAQNSAPGNMPLCTSNTKAASSIPSHQSRSFLAVEFNKDRIMLKAYFMPEFKARTLDCGTMDVISRAIQSLPVLSSNLLTSHDRLRNFLSSDQGKNLEPEIVAVDCVSPEKARIKIYMRSQVTSLQSVIDTLCLADLSQKKRLKQCLEEFRKIWELVFSPVEGLLEELPLVHHRTAGMLYYFGLENHKACPSVKVYLPIRHYAQNDAKAASGLQTYIRSTRYTDFSDEYTEALNKIMLLSPYTGQKGLQTYLAIAIHRNELKLTSYLSPIVYKT